MFRNFLTLSTGEVMARALHALGFVFLARALGPQTLGVFEIAVAVIAYLYLLIQQGFDTIAMREVSRMRSGAANWFYSIVFVRLTCAVVVSALIAVYGYLTRWHNPASELLLILCISYFANSITPRWIFLAHERSRPPAIASMLAQFIFLASILLFVHHPEQMWRAAVGWVAGDVLATAFLWSQMERTWLDRSSARVSISFLLRESWPVSVSLLMGQMLYNFDVLVLAAMNKGQEIGFYLAAYRCITGLGALISQFQISIFPAFSRVQDDRRTLMIQGRRLGIWAALCGLAAALFLWAGAEPLIGLVFGKAFLPAARFLRVLAWALPLQSIRAVLRTVLLAAQHQKSDTRNAGLGLATNVLGDFALVPRWGALGCSISTIASEFVLVGAAIQAIRQKLPGTPR